LLAGSFFDKVGQANSTKAAEVRNRSHMKNDFETARDVAEYLLERTGEAIMSGDFALFETYFCLPQTIETFEGSCLVTTRDELKVVFDAVRTYYEVKGVTQLSRRCVAADFKDAESIASTYETRLISGAQIVQKPFPAFSTLKRVDGEWRIASCIYAIEDSPEHNKALTRRHQQK
jgi:hypothetical protein